MLSLLLASLPQIIFAPRVVDPSQHRSPDGAYQLSIDPTHPYGVGAAHYRLVRDGNEAWATELPYTLTEVRVLDSGVVVGYSDVCALREVDCELVVAAVAPDGEILYEGHTPRTSSRLFICGAKILDNPSPLALSVDAQGDRFALLIRDPDFNPRRVSLRRYDLTTGERLPDLTPAAATSDDALDLYGVSRAVLLDGADLVLLQGWSRSWNDDLWGGRNQGASFALARESDGLYVWQLDLPLKQRVTSPDIVVGAGPDGQFTLWHVEDGEQVRYRAVADASADRGWRVEVVERTPFVPLEPRLESLETPPIRHLELVELEELPLAVEKDPTTVLNRPVETAHLEDGEFLVVVRGEEPNRFVHERLSRCDAAGALDRRFWIRPLRADPHGRSAPGELPLLAVNADGSRSLRVERIFTSRRAAALLLLGSQGEELARLERTFDNRWLGDIVGATFLPDGTLAVVHRPGRTPLSDAGELVVYDQNGRALDQHAVGPTHRELLAAGRWIIFPPGQAWFPPGVAGRDVLGLYDLESGEIFHAELGLEGGPWVFGLSADGARFLALDGKRRTLSRWALP